MLSILPHPKQCLPTKVQVGFPELPEPESDLFYRIMELWINYYDNHLGSLPLPLPAPSPFELTTLFPCPLAFTSAETAHHGSSPLSLTVLVHSFSVSSQGPDEVKLLYDTDRTSASDGPVTQCMVVAKMKGGSTDLLRRHHVLLVSEMVGGGGSEEMMYQRVGVEFMLGRHIDFEEEGVRGQVYLKGIWGLHA